MKILLGIFLSFILLFIWCSLRIASMCDQYELEEKDENRDF